VRVTRSDAEGGAFGSSVLGFGELGGVGRDVMARSFQESLAARSKAPRV
jgi:hypothetical protein